jgi:hypothetical protein
VSVDPLEALVSLDPLVLVEAVVSVEPLEALVSADPLVLVEADMSVEPLEALVSADPLVLVEADVSVEPLEALVSADPLELVDALVSVEALEPLVEVLVSTDALVSIEALEPLVEVLVSTEALVAPLVPLEVPTSTEALVEPLVSTEAVVPVGRELVSSAWAIPGRTPSRPTAPNIARQRRTHRRRRCSPLLLKNALSPNDLSGSCTHRPPSTGQASCLPFGGIYPRAGTPNSLTQRGEKPQRPKAFCDCPGRRLR